MCLGVPAKILHIQGQEALVDLGGVKQSIRLDLLPEARLGDYVLLHAGFAISLLQEEEALERLRLFEEIRALS